MEQRFFEKKPLLFSFFVLFGLLFVLDILLGFILIPKNLNTFRTSDPVYHHGLLPNQNTITVWGPIAYPFKTNSLGFRDSSNYQISLKSNKKRILILGDSHSEAVGVRFEKSYFGLLQQKALSQNVELLNASAVSYSPKIHYLKAQYLIEEIGLHIDEILVAVDLSDLQNELAYEKFTPSKPTLINEITTQLHSVLKKHSFIYYTIAKLQASSGLNRFAESMNAFNKTQKVETDNNTIELYATFFNNFSDKELLSNPEFHGVGQWYYDSAFIKLADKGLELGQKNITQLKTLCDKHHIKLSLSVHPWQTQVMKQDTSDYYVKNWAKFCKENNIRFCNLFPVFINGQNPHFITKHYYLENDNHWNDAGHALVAKRLEIFLLSDSSNNKVNQ